MRLLGRRLWLPVLTVALLHLGISLVRGRLGAPEAPPPARRGPIMVAAGGPIELLEIQFHRPGARLFLEVYRQLFSALDPRTRVLVVVADERDRELFEAARRGWAAGGRAQPSLRYVLVGRPITSWARDRLAVLDPVGEGGLTILAPPTPMVGPESRANDWLVPFTLRRGLGEQAGLMRAPFRFEGGDLIADEGHVYVASPLFDRNPGRSAASLVRSLGATLSRPVVRLGTDELPAPSHHIGMFLTPLGDGVVAYGDPDLGLALIGDRERLSVGGAPFVVVRSPHALEPFRRVARTLEAEGLRTLALPLLVSTEAHAWISYDNVLMERRSDGRLHVYMPAYGLPELDARAREIYESLGAVVHPIRVEEIFRLGGTVRCLGAPLLRGRTPQPPRPGLRAAAPPRWATTLSRGAGRGPRPPRAGRDPRPGGDLGRRPPQDRHTATG